MKKTIEQIKIEALKELETTSDRESIDAISVRYLGRKGMVTKFLRNISNLPIEERPGAGKRANEIKKDLDKLFKEALKKLEARSSITTDNQIDVSLPGRTVRQGSLHPITQITWQICEIFTRLGFDIVEGPEVETDYYNFEALNIPKKSSCKRYAGHLLHLKKHRSSNSYLSNPAKNNGKTETTGKNYCARQGLSV